MASRRLDTMMDALGELRFEPTEKRVRAVLDDAVVVDSRRAVLVWEPGRVVPSYAVPVDDVLADLVPGRAPVAGPPERRILHPGIPFAVHSTAGDPLDLRIGGRAREGIAFALADPDLAGSAVLDFRGFDTWLEEDEPVVGHPRDPFHRVDVRRSSRRVRIEREGRVLAESARPSVVFETGLPVRFYLPPEDVEAELRPTARRTLCAYKGEASYWALGSGGDLAWSYPAPLPDAAGLTGLVAFFDEFVDVTVDGERRERPTSGISAMILEEAGVGFSH